MGTKVMSDVRREVGELRLEMKAKVTLQALREWIDDSRQAYSTELCELRKETQGLALRHTDELERHAGWMKQVSQWLAQVQVREQGLTHILCHIVENNQASAELLKLLEDALKVPKLRGVEFASR